MVWNVLLEMQLGISELVGEHEVRARKDDEEENRKVRQST